MKLEVKKDVKSKQNDGYVVEYCFTIGEQDYWKVPDLAGAGSARTLEAMKAYEEVSMRCSYDYLKNFTEAFETLINSGKVDMIALIRMHNDLKERIMWGMSTPDLIYKLATVVYMDDSESALKYDYAYNEQKAAIFKECGNDFFLSKPIKELIPSLNISEIDLAIYLQVLKQVDMKHKAHLRHILQSQAKNHLSLEQN